MSTTKRRRTRKHLTYGAKKGFIREIENSSIDAVAWTYGLKLQTLYGFIKNKEAILKACEDGLGRKKKIPKKCVNSSGKKTEEKKNDVKISNVPSASRPSDDWSEIINRYAESDIYLATEVGLFFKTKVEECRMLRNETCDLGEKAVDRFTVFVSANLAGTDLNLVVVGKSSKLATNLTVKYHCDDTSWMTAEVFEKELKDWDVKLEEENRKIVLFTEEKMVHRLQGNIRNIQLRFYTEKISEEKVPFDMARYMKAVYRRNIMENINRDPTFKITPKNALLELRQAWKSVPPEAVRSSFVEAGIINGDRLNMYLSVINSWSQLVSPDYSLLKVYTEFDDNLVTSAEGYAESEESDSDEGTDRLVTVAEAFDAARTLRDYCAQGSLEEDLRDQVLDILAKVQEQMRAFRSLVPESQQPSANDQEGRRSSCRDELGRYTEKEMSSRVDQEPTPPQKTSRDNQNAQPRKKRKMPAKPVNQITRRAKPGATENTSVSHDQDHSAQSGRQAEHVVNVRPAQNGHLDTMNRKTPSGRTVEHDKNGVTGNPGHSNGSAQPNKGRSSRVEPGSRNQHQDRQDQQMLQLSNQQTSSGSSSHNTRSSSGEGQHVPPGISTHVPNMSRHEAILLKIYGDVEVTMRGPNSSSKRRNEEAGLLQKSSSLSGKRPRAMSAPTIAKEDRIFVGPQGKALQSIVEESQRAAETEQDNNAAASETCNAASPIIQYPSCPTPIPPTSEITIVRSAPQSTQVQPASTSCTATNPTPSTARGATRIQNPAPGKFVGPPK